MAMGYQGLAQVQITRDLGSGYVPLLINGSSINMQLNPMFSEAVWGAGWYNAATNVNYADNAITYEGGLEFQLQASSNVWNLIRDWAIEYRAFSRAARITPDASWVYYYGPSQANEADYNDAVKGRQGIWCRGLSLNTSEGSFVEGSLDCVALFRTVKGPSELSPVDSNLNEVDPAQISYIDDRFGLSEPNNPLNPQRPEYGNEPNFDPIPYWRTRAYVKRDGVAMTSGGLDIETLDWSVDLTNNTQILYTCRGVRGASAILQGSIDVSGNVTLYNPYGLPDPVFGFGSNDEFDPYLIADNTSFEIEIAGTNGLAIVLPAVVVESDEYSVRGQNEVTSRTYSLKGLGGKKATDTGYTPDNFAGDLSKLSLPPMYMIKAV
jgi:hypothetical protein